MTDLLDLTMNAHGGLERWRQVHELDISVSLTGPMSAIKGHPHGILFPALRRVVRRTDEGARPSLPTAILI